MLQIFTLGMALGLYAAAMPGPINLEVIRRSISRGPRIGLSFGLGASFADVTFALLSSLGALALINSMPIWGKAIMWIAGAVILFWLGLRGLRAKVPTVAAAPTGVTNAAMLSVAVERTTPGQLVRQFFVGLTLTLSSPPTIMFWVFSNLMIAGTHLTGTDEENQDLPFLLAAGVGVACVMWVSAAVYVSSRFHRNLRPQTYLWIERITGTALCCFATYAVYEALKIMISKGVVP